MYRQDVYANNLANMDTPGFKVDLPSSYPRDAVRPEDGVWQLPSNSLLERLGGGALLNRNLVSFAQGSPRETGNPLDLAVRGNGFFVVRDQGGSDDAKVKLTRDGRFTLNSSGQLVMAGTGLPVLDVSQQPIVLKAGAVKVSGDGKVTQGGAVVAQLALIDVPDTARLTKAGNSLFVAPNDALKGKTPATGTIRQGSIEESTVDEIKALLDVTSATRDVDWNTEMIRQHDRLLDKAINTFGRVV